MPEHEPDPILGMMSDKPPRGRIAELSPAMAADIVLSQTCPACGMGKTSCAFFCDPCLVKLPRSMRRGRISVIKEPGFGKLMRNALNYLGCRNIHTPQGSFNMVPRNRA